MENKRLFCPNCGNPVDTSTHFCGKCGFDIQSYLENQHDVPYTQNQNSESEPAPQAKQSSNEPVKPKKPFPKWASILILVLVLLLGGGYFFGKNYYQPNKQLDRAVAAIKNDKDLPKHFATTDPNLKLTNKNLDPISQQMGKDKQKLSSFKSQLYNNGETSDGNFRFKQNGNAWLIFPKYSVFVKAAYPTISTNHSGISLYVNKDKVKTTTSSNQTVKVGPLVPGLYQLKSNGTVSGHNMTNDGSFTINGSSDNFDLSLKTISFDVKSYPETQIYLNGKYKARIGAGGTYSFKEIPWSSIMKMQLRYKTKGGEISSEKVPITEDDSDTTVTAAFPGILSMEDSDSLISGMFYTVDSLTSSMSDDDSDSDDEDYLAKCFDGGSTNNQYKQLVDMAHGYAKDDNIDSVSYDTKVTRVVPSGLDKTDVTYQVKYDFDNDDDSGDHIQVFEYTATIMKKGSGDSVDNDSYKISTISSGTKISDKHEDE